MRTMTALVSAFVGAGLASGEEIGSFFAVYGEDAIWAIASASLTLAAAGSRLASLIRTAGCDELLTRLFGSYAPLVYAVIGVFYLAVLSVMIAGASVIGSLLSLAPAVSVATVLTLLYGLSHLPQAATRANLWVTPCVLSLVVGASVYSLLYHDMAILLPSSPIPPCRPLISGLSYVSYNLLLSLPILAGLPTASRSSVYAGGLSAGIVLALLLGCLVTVVLCHDASSPMVMLSVAQMQHDVCFYAYAAALAMALVTSGLSALVGVTMHLPPMPREVGTLLTLTVALIISQIGFSVLVDTILPILSLPTVLVTLRLLLPVRGDTPRHSTRR